MMGIGFQVSYDAADPRALGEFWALALGYRKQDPPEGFASWEAALESWGMPQESWNDAYALVDPDGTGPRLYFQKVPEPKTAKNRVHLDVNVGRAVEPGDRVATCRAHAERLVAAGGRVVREFGDESSDEFWIVMTDVEGNEFCLQ